MPRLAPDVFHLPGLLTPAECLAVVARAEAVGFTPAPVRTQGGLPAGMGGGEAVGLDPDFRVYRYDVGQRFNRHKDGSAERPGERTRLTGLVYLNDGFTGGETAFFADELTAGVRAEVLAVAPEAGAGLFFRHDWWHEGRALTAGRKYVLRTDVFFRLGGG